MAKSVTDRCVENNGRYAAGEAVHRCVFRAKLTADSV